MPLPHWSARADRQLLHTEPIAPHAMSVDAWQLPLKQQPDGQVAALQPEQVPPWQALGALHVWHAAPPWPHAVSALPVRQMSPSQQPSHVAGVQAPIEPPPPPPPPPIAPAPPAPPPVPAEPPPAPASQLPCRHLRSLQHTHPAGQVPSSSHANEVSSLESMQ